MNRRVRTAKLDAAIAANQLTPESPPSCATRCCPRDLGGTLKIARLMLESGHARPEVSLRAGAVVMTFGLRVQAT